MPGSGGSAGDAEATGGSGNTGAGFWTRTTPYSYEYGGAALFDVTSDFWVVQNTETYFTRDAGRTWERMRSGFVGEFYSEDFFVIGLDHDHKLLARWLHPNNCDTGCVGAVPGNPGERILLEFDVASETWTQVSTLPTEFTSPNALVSSTSTVWMTQYVQSVRSMWRYDGSWTEEVLPLEDFVLRYVRVSPDGVLTVFGGPPDSDAVYQRADSDPAGQWTEIPAPDDQHPSNVVWRDLQVDDAGRIYVIDNDHVYRRDGDGWVDISPPHMPEISTTAPDFRAAVAPSGVIALVNREYNLDTMTGRPPRVWTSSDFGATYTERRGITDSWFVDAFHFDAQERLFVIGGSNESVVWHTTPVSEW